MNFSHSLTTSKVLRVLLYVLIFFQPFNRFNSFREISFYGLLILFVIKLAKGEIKNIVFKDKTIIALSLLAGWSLLVSIFGPYPIDSLNAIRKNLLKEILIFLVIITEFKSIRELKTLFWIVVASFTVVTFASIVENAVVDWDNFRKIAPSTSWRANSKMFFARYANKATFYLPFIVGWLISIKEPTWKKWIGVITLFAGLILVYIYNARTPFLAIPIAIGIILVLSKKYKLIITSVIVAISILCITVMLPSKTDRFSRYKSLSNPKTYITDSGLTNRLGIWLVALDIIKERPLVGYGYGWKKMAWVVKDSSLVESWKGKYPSAYVYYVEDAHLSYGKVNPHNLAIQIGFEIGVVGLAIFIWLWSTVILKLSKALNSKEGSETRSFMLCSIGVIVSYAMINITTGFWQEDYGNMIFLFIASVFVIYRGYIHESKIHT